MGKGWIKVNRDAMEYLLENDPNCYLLLSQIALRARRTNEEINHLDLGQAMIGDYKNCGLTHRKYRTALTKLIKMNLVTIKTTNKGTIATLLDTRSFDINIDSDRQTERQMSDKQETTNKKKERKNIKEEEKEILKKVMELFEEFWKVYPLKIGKSKCKDKWLKINLNENLTQTIIESVTKQIEAGMLNVVELKYCPHPLTWLNQKRWEDPIVQMTNKGQSPKSGNVPDGVAAMRAKLKKEKVQ